MLKCFRVLFINCVTYCVPLLPVWLSGRHTRNKEFNVFQIPIYCTIYLLDKTHVKIRESNNDTGQATIRPTEHNITYTNTRMPPSYQ